jgi:hypothetical protein
MARSWHGRFGTWKLIVDNQTLYFRTMDEIKQYFKQMVKDLTLELMQNALKVLLNYIPTESGQLAAAIYNSSVYGVMDWKNQIICQFRVVDPKFYVFVTSTKGNQSKSIKNPSHSHSRHRSSRAPDTTLNNPNVHLIGTRGKSYIYDRDDPLATTNYLAVMRKYMKDMIATAISRILRKTYYVHYYIKVSKQQYGKDSFLNPSTPIVKRKTNILTGKVQNLIPNNIDEFGTFLTLYTRP